jgi:hypothetical protein
MIAKKRRAQKPAMKKPSMDVVEKGHPGLELDAKGKPIPFGKRLAEDRQKVRRASKRRKAKSKKTKRKKTRRKQTGRKTT